jgi:hypothetical protein
LGRVEKAAKISAARPTSSPSQKKEAKQENFNHDRRDNINDNILPWLRHDHYNLSFAFSATHFLKWKFIHILKVRRDSISIDSVESQVEASQAI